MSLNRTPSAQGFQSCNEAQSENPQWSALSTEAPNPASERLDAMSSEKIVSILLEEDQRGLECARRQNQEIACAAEWFARAVEAGDRVLFAGAGTSGRLGILEAAECPPTFGTDPDQIRAVIAGGPDAVFKAQEGAEDVFEDGAAAAENLGAGDLLIGLSASSATPFVRGALHAARHGGTLTILITCAPPTGLEGLADLVIALDTGSEVLTGSTRLKAGSATKAVLNAITTAAMVRLGKVYKNLMVDLRPGSAKLRDRAVRIIAAAGEVSRDEAVQLYDTAGQDVKTAIVMALCDCNPESSRNLLRRTGGNVRAALDYHAGKEDRGHG
jgi:N-acetylmuramic acid 6-phosphate etherase